MLSGIQALGEIDHTLKTVKPEIHRIDAELAQQTQQLTNNKRQQLSTLQAIAKVRLDSIGKGDLLSYLSAADQNALKLLKKREQAINKLEKSILTQQEKQEKLEIQRQSLLENANQIAEQLAANEAEVQSNLTKDKIYQDALKRTQDADSVADEAERKAQASAENLQEKGKPYQADELFMYLWERRYGTADYSNYNPITRLLDGWVAKKIKYHHSRANYWNIQEIPKRLHQHAESVREQADAFIVDLENLEKQALKKNGALKIQQSLGAAHKKVDKCDDSIRTAEEQLNALVQQRSDYLSGEDSFSQQAIQQLQDGLEHQNLTGLSQIVHATQSSKDDALLQDLYRFQETYQALQEDVQNLRLAHNTKLKRLKELEEVRRNFKRHRFDDMRSGFSNEAVIGAILGQFLEGIVNGSELWRVIQRNQQHRDVGAWPDYGSGGLGRKSSGSVFGDISMPRPRRSRARQNSPWHWPDSGNGGFQLPRSRSGRPSSKGGFKTGGGF